MDILELLRDFQGSISGIIGALAGLSCAHFIKHIGQTYVEFYDINFKYIKTGNGPYRIDVIEIEPLVEGRNTCKYSMNVEIYYSSETPRVLRNIQIQFYKSNRLIVQSIPKDCSTMRITAA